MESTTTMPSPYLEHHGILDSFSPGFVEQSDEHAADDFQTSSPFPVLNHNTTPAAVATSNRTIPFGNRELNDVGIKTSSPSAVTQPRTTLSKFTNSLVNMTERPVAAEPALAIMNMTDPEIFEHVFSHLSNDSLFNQLEPCLESNDSSTPPEITTETNTSQENSTDGTGVSLLTEVMTAKTKEINISEVTPTTSNEVSTFGKDKTSNSSKGSGAPVTQVKFQVSGINDGSVRIE